MRRFTMYKIIYSQFKYNNIQPIQWCRAASTESVTLSTKWTANLDKDLEENLRNDTVKIRKHPGRMTVKNVQLPNKLQAAIQTILQNYSLRDLKENSDKFLQFLASRRQPVENDEIQSKAKEVYKQLNNQRGEIESLPLEEQEIEKKRRTDWVEESLRHKLYHWKPIEFNAYKGMLYLLGRIAPNYAVLYQIFHEIQKRDASFHPTSLFDFGSGVGTVSWAAKEFWGASLREFFNVDISDEMNEIARLLLQGGKEGSETSLKGVFFRQFTPASSLINYNIVVSAFSLLELPNVESRLKTIDSLWRKTQDYLVIVEDGTNAGYECVIEARDYVLACKEEKESEACHVFSPCTHDQTCPRFNDGTYTPCNFDVGYHPLPLGKRDTVVIRHRFSYVVIRKKPRDENQVWPRIVREVLRKGGHTICRLCTQDGRLTELTLTKSKHGEELYKCARVSAWGDLLPITDLKLKTAEEVAKEKEAKKTAKISKDKS